ncbi:flagellar motor switch protein FliN [Rhizobium sp. C1]|uniref:flagellar motor switch protein FliN n=1 Tax=Rhizobium sp. C1 TaxID=1349799 RepID=UPI001E316294|nr:flagellar motor switch protein FliN [Rhizobium sp. C1]MCD2179008.1 flagellar motor switch protein FliN [Rhizobium sp. C1]
MAKQTTKTGEEPVEDDILANFSSDAAPDLDTGLDDQIDSLRGVLKSDAEGGLPEFGEGGGFDFDASSDGAMGETDLSQFGGGFGGGMDAGFGGGMSDHGHTTGSALHANIDLIMDIPIDVQIVLGNSHMHVATLMNLTEGATIALDRKIGEPVEVVVNGRQIGRGEITVLDEDNTRFGIRMIEVKPIKR